MNRTIGLYAAVSKVDEVVRLIRSSADSPEAQAKLMQMEFETEGELEELLYAADPILELIRLIS